MGTAFQRALGGFLAAGAFLFAAGARATTDYAPAVDRMLTCAKYYTSGYGKKFVVIHDMEGYYLTGISYLRRCDTDSGGDYNVSVSCHYVVNGLKDYSTDAERGEVSQLVRESNYSWHAVCWNRYSTGTEHEGFASDPAWYTEEMYQASADLHRHLCDKYKIAKDRNHVIAHGQKSVAGWPAWASANLGIDPYCNSHTDPGPYWNWSHYMALLTATNSAEEIVYDQSVTNIFGNGTNVVDVNATTVPFNAVGFSNAVKTAFATNHGGVFDFPTTIASGTTLYRGKYAGGTKVLHLGSSSAMQNANSSGGTYYPISNPNFTTTQPSSADYSLGIGPIYDAADNLLPGEGVSAIGFVMLSRTDAAYPLSVRATATFNDGSTQAVTSVVGTPRGTADTFFGFAAPAGLTISKLRLQSFATGTGTPVTNKMAFDDFGFITREEPWTTDPAGGWTGPWDWTSDDPELQGALPLDETGSYLCLDSTNGSIRNFMREYKSGAVNINAAHYIRWKFRLAETNFAANFSVFNDRVHFFAHPVSRISASTASGNSWAILAAGATNAGAMGGKTFWIFDNVDGTGAFSSTNLLDSGVPLLPQHVYAFSVLVLPVSKTYWVRIQDTTSGTNFASSAPHRFRDLSGASHNFLHFGTQASSSDLRRPFHLDSVAVLPAPAPVTLLNALRSGADNSFSFQSQTGIDHTVEYSVGAAGGTWSSFVTVSGDGATKVFVHTNAPAGTVLYRVNSRLP